MKKINKFIFTIVLFFVFHKLYTQDYWRVVSAPRNNISTTDKSSSDSIYYFELKPKLLKQVLFDNTATNKSSRNRILLPNEFGNLETFYLREVQTLSEELQNQFPDIRTYIGWSEDREDVKIRMSFSPLGVSNMIRLPKGETFFLQPYHNQENLHFIYSPYKVSYEKKKCLTQSIKKNSSPFSLPRSYSYLKEESVNRSSDRKLRTYRIAVSANGEYTNYWGSKANAFAAITNTINRINEIFETDFAIHLTLVSNTNIIYDNPARDPYSENFNVELQNTLSQEIGNANYDIGHLFGRGNIIQGDAGCIGCVCVTNRKGRGYSFSNFRAPFLNDYFDIDLVAHEIGHQFGAFHIFSYLTEGMGSSIEPGSGTTIMSYAGITGPNDLQSHSDPYFNYINIEQIEAYVTSATSCGTFQNITNMPPVANAGQDYAIPKMTAYELIASATDANDNPLSFCWEQLDNGLVTNENFGPNNLIGAMNRSLLPKADSIRSIPRMSSVLSGRLTQNNPILNSTWETVSNMGRTLRWGVTIRDRDIMNNLQDAQNSRDNMVINVETTAGPFSVISQNSAREIWQSGSLQTIIWNVNNTDKLPVNTKSVDIRLSIDGGQTFPFLLIENTPNDGNEEIFIPHTNATENARIKIIPKNNIYFAINSTPFSIQNRAFIFSFDKRQKEVCQNEEVTFNLTYNNYLEFNQLVSISLSGNNLLSGAVFQLSRNSISGNNATLTITGSNFNNVIPADYTIALNGRSPDGNVNYSYPFKLSVRSATFSNDINLTSPAPNATNVLPNTTFMWESNNNATQYIFELSKENTFSNFVIKDTISIPQREVSNLESNTTYFWRVKKMNKCADSNFSQIRSFQSQEITCKEYISIQSTPVIITDAMFRNNGTTILPGETRIPINISDTLIIEDILVNLDITHTYSEDLTIILESPYDQEFILADQIGASNNNFTNTSFSNTADNSIVSGKNPYTGTFRPMQSFFPLIGQNAFGKWYLKIIDNYTDDIGQLNSYSIQFCVRGVPENDTDRDSWVDSRDNCPSTVNEDQADSNNNGMGDACDLRYENNIQISILNKSCSNENNGSFRITARAAFDYSLRLVNTATGKIVRQQNFINNVTITGAGIGTYNACITAPDEDSDFEKCILVDITTLPELSNIITSELNKQTNIIRLRFPQESGVSYTLELNGDRQSFSNNSPSFRLQEGLNYIKVSSNFSCQGIYEQYVYVAEKSTFYPNPVENLVNIFIPGEETEVKITVYNIAGNIVLNTKTYNVSSINRRILINLSNINTGIYILKIDKGINVESLKIIKK